MTDLQRALRAMTAAVYAAAILAKEQGHPDAPELQKMALAADDIAGRNIRVPA